jgi:hypothetical protein
MSITSSWGIQPEQIAEASWIHDHVPGWLAKDQALDLLRVSLADFSEEAVLAKAAAVDRLYNTKNRHLVESARKISETFPTVTAASPGDPVALVEAIAPVPVNGKTYWHWSFASKFTHFFVHPDRVPVYDNWAVKACEHYLGGLQRNTGHKYDWYRHYAEQILLIQKDLGCSVRALDRFLYLCGHYWASDPPRLTNITEALGWSAEDLAREPDLMQHLKRMLGLEGPVQETDA